MGLPHCCEITLGNLKLWIEQGAVDVEASRLIEPGFGLRLSGFGKSWPGTSVALLPVSSVFLTLVL
jgi:hypothetical protein